MSSDKKNIRNNCNISLIISHNIFFSLSLANSGLVRSKHQNFEPQKTFYMVLYVRCILLTSNYTDSAMFSVYNTYIAMSVDHSNSTESALKLK